MQADRHMNFKMHSWGTECRCCQPVSTVHNIFRTMGSGIRWTLSRSVRAWRPVLAVTGGRRPASPHLSVLRRDLSTFRYWATAALSHNRGQHLPLLADGGLGEGKPSQWRAYFTGTRRPRMLFVQVTIVTWRNAMVHLITRSHISASGWKVYIQALLTHNEAILRNGQKDDLLLKHVLCLHCGDLKSVTSSV